MPGPAAVDEPVSTEELDAALDAAFVAGPAPAAGPDDATPQLTLF